MANVNYTLEIVANPLTPLIGRRWDINPVSIMRLHSV